jgi:peptidyl-prolyl cis-trans isomerase A (cyclophilin A)
MNTIRRHWVIIGRNALAACAAGLCTLAIAQTPAGATAMKPPAAPAPVVVTLDTSAGPIVLELDAAAAPRTVANFMSYVKEGFYAGTIFHRVIPGFMIQGGGYNEAMQHKPTHAPIAIESNNGLKNVRGSIAMARTMDPNSATAQFFINVVDNPGLDYPGGDNAGYTVFGHVVEGMDNVDKIRMAETTVRAGMPNVPVTPAVIRKARLGR